MFFLHVYTWHISITGHDHDVWQPIRDFIKFGISNNQIEYKKNELFAIFVSTFSILVQERCMIRIQTQNDDTRYSGILYFKSPAITSLAKQNADVHVELSTV